MLAISGEHNRVASAAYPDIDRTQIFATDL